MHKLDINFDKKMIHGLEKILEKSFKAMQLLQKL